MAAQPAPGWIATAAGSALPVLFLEARVQGTTHHLISQMGVSIDADQCSVGLFSRTSGVLLIAGFGSYCAYRIANRILGNGFVYTLFDAAHCDLLARADIRLLHPDPPGSLRSAISLDEFDDVPERGNVLRKASRARSLTRKDDTGRKYIQVIEHPTLSRVHASSTPKAGLAALSSGEILKCRVRSRMSSQCFDDACSIAESSFSDASRIRRGERRPHFLRADQEPDEFGDDDDDDDDGASVAPTETSEIRLMWDGDACWDDEFSGAMNDDPHRSRAMSLTPSDISELSAFKTLQDMFNAPSTSTAPMPPPSESVFGDASDLAQLIHEKCTRDPDYMYHSVIVASSDADGNSDIVSVCSGRSARSNFSIFREKHKAASRRSQGLWELTASREYEKSDTARQMCFLEPGSTGCSTSISSANIMTDSGISKSSFTSSSKRERGRSASSSYNGQMIDSAIDTGFQSSDDESVSAIGSTFMRPSNNGIVRKAVHLDGIKEQPSPIRSLRPRSSIAPSERSLEWFDD